MRIFLSHDVDYTKNIPLSHILKRKDRFTDKVINNYPVKNPYDNILEFKDIEKSLGVKSTFFFRTKYETGSYLEYEDEIKELVKGGWEIGMHSDVTSVCSLGEMKQEKSDLEGLMCGKKIIGNRVHYLEFRNELIPILNSLGFKYDSSMMFSKDEIIPHEPFMLDKILEIPLTWMDAYLFTYMKIKEDDLIDMFQGGNNDTLTLLWHSNVLHMKGGRMYGKILESLMDHEIIMGKDLV